MSLKDELCKAKIAPFLTLALFFLNSDPYLTDIKFRKSTSWTLQ